MRDPARLGSAIRRWLGQVRPRQIELEAVIPLTSALSIRTLLARLLDWEDAHVSLDKAVADIPVELRGTRPSTAPYSCWELLEHIRIAQHDILDFCVNPDYEEMAWPADYWPSSSEPPSAHAWTESIDHCKRDRRALQALANDPAIDLDAKIPHGSGQTYLRELLLVADHNTYHVGQIVLVRKMLGAWPS
jgi:uncharacterized damage-inducible protein DinB